MNAEPALTSVLVPLDGTTLSEEILSPALRIVAGGPAPGRVALLRATSTRRGQPGHDAEVEAARAYLDEVERRLRPDLERVEVEAHVQAGEPAKAVLELAQGLDVDLVAIATRGREGAERWLRGNVAEQVLGSCPVPVLAANPRALADGGDAFRRVLVPLDGSARAEAVVPLAGALAKRLGAPLDLLHVLEDEIPWGDQHDPQARVAPAAERLKELGVEARLKVARGAPVDAVLEATEEDPMPLLVMATHGRTGLLRLAFGSVADAVIRRSRCPVVVRR